MANLVELFDNIVQMQNLNGVPLAAGKLYVYALGRTRLMDSWSDVDGESLNPNPIILDDAGQAHVYVSDDFDYTLVICDQYNNEIFSLDKYLYSKGSHSHADVAVAPSESIAVSSYHVGECTVYVPYLTGQLGKVYEGIDPIVVNNQVDKISANHVPLGVQDPLYFVQDDEEGCIIGLSGGTVPEGTMNESAFGYQDGQITSYNGSAFSAGNSYEAGSYVDIDGNTINVTGLQPAGNYQSAGDYVSASELENLQPKGDYYSASNPSGFITGVDLTDYAKTEDLTAYQPVGDYYSASNPSGFINSDAISSMATTGFVANVSGDITALIPTDLFTKESADTLYQPIGNYQTAGNYVSASELSAYATTSLVSSVSSTITGMIPTGDFELVAGTNIELVDDAVNHTTTINMTADIPSTAGLATTAQLSDVSADITAMIPTDLFTKASADTLYQPIGDYLTTADSANFYTTANESGFITGIPAGTLNESAFEYDANNKISGYNGSAFAGGGVSGTNVVFVPQYEGANYGSYYSARISGDVVVTTGTYFGDDIYPGTTGFSLSSVGASIGNKLDKDKIEASNTIKIINNHAEVTDKAYRQTGFIDISAHNVGAGGSTVNVDFVSYDANNDSYLYSAIVTVETTASGSYIPNGWSLVSYENNSATFTKYYSLNERTDTFYLATYYGDWGDFTNAEGSATVYSALEIAPLAFKDDITGITYTTGTI